MHNVCETGREQNCNKVCETNHKFKNVRMNAALNTTKKLKSKKDNFNTWYKDIVQIGPPLKMQPWIMYTSLYSTVPLQKWLQKKNE